MAVAKTIRNTTCCIFAILTCVLTSSAQRYYGCDISDPFFHRVELELDAANKYMLHTGFVWKGGCVSIDYAISSGTYTEDRTSIRLTDQFLGYELIFKKAGDYLQATVAYPFLKNKTLEYRGKNLDSLFYARAISTNTSPEMRRPDSFTKHNLLPPIKEKRGRRTPKKLDDLSKVSIEPGIYSFWADDPHQCYWEGGWVELTTSTYKAFFGKSVISSGRYTQHNGTMIFSDENLSVDFPFEIANDSLFFSKNFIADYGGTWELKRVKNTRPCVRQKLKPGR